MSSVVSDGMFEVSNKDYEKLLKLADVVLSTRDEMSQEYVFANALQQRLEEAIENKEDSVLFTEQEVQCLSVVVGDN